MLLWCKVLLWGCTYRIIKILVCRCFQPSFISFVLMNFLQIYHSTFLANFASIICDQLIGKDFLPPTLRSIFYGFMYIVPQVNLCKSHIYFFKLITAIFDIVSQCSNRPMDRLDTLPSYLKGINDVPLINH